MAHIISPTRWRIRPPQSVTLNLGHPLASGLVSVLMPGRAGMAQIVDPLHRDTIPRRSSPSMAQTVLGEAVSGAGGDYGTSSIVAPTPWLKAARGNIGAWTIAAGIQLGTTSQSKYVYFEGSGGLAQFALIYGFSSGNYELFATGYSSSDPRTSSQTGVSDTQMHCVGYSLKGSASAEYAKWLDGKKTVISSSFSFVPPTGTIRALLGSDATTDNINAAISYLYIWDRYVDLSWVAAEPFAMFGEGTQGRVYGFFGSTSGGGGAGGLRIHPGMQGGMRPLMLGGCNG